MRSTLLLFVVAGAISLWSCSNDKVTDSKVVSQPGGKPGWTSIQSSDGTVTISVPPNWRPMNLDSSTFRKRIDNAASKDPRISRFRGATDELESRHAFKVMFQNPTESGNFKPNGNIISLPTRGTLDALVRANIRELSGPGITISRAQVSLNGGDFEQISYSVESKTTHTLVDHRNYITTKNGKMYLLNFAIPRSDQADHALMAQIADSMKING